MALLKTAGLKRSGHITFLGRLWRVSAAAVALLLLAMALSIFNNNVSLSRRSRADFVKTLDHSLAASTGWTMGQYISGDPALATAQGKEFVDNAALAHMLVDCAAMSGDPRLRQLAVKFVAARHADPNLWAKMVDPAIAVSSRSSSDLDQYLEYQRWMLHGVSPEGAPLSAPELADMFSPHKFRTGKATHQLFALYFYRKFNGETPKLDGLMDGVEERIAAEAAFDFRVTDLYLQRIAFLLAVGRPDLVKPRWVERALSAQQSDGGWLNTWYGWAPHPLNFTFSDQHSVAHSTAQGMWLTHMLKHRYPGWIDKHYK